METFVASRPIANLDQYRDELDDTVYRSSTIMRPIFENARASERRIAFAEGEDERVLRTAHSMMEIGIDRPILIGRPEVMERRIETLGLPLTMDRDFEVVNPQQDSRYRDYWETYHSLMERRGITPALARTITRTNTTVIAATMVQRGEADSMICGTFGQYLWPEQIAETAIGAARHVRRFGLEPRVALCSHSQFGNLDTEGGRRMRAAIAILDASHVGFTYEGEMHSDAALDPQLRDRIFPNSRLKGPANVLIFSNVDAASGVRNVLKTVSGSLEVGPILMGMGNKAFIATPSITPRGLGNMAALAGTSVNIYA